MGNFRTFLLAAILIVALGTDAFPFCFEEAGAQYGINPQILRAIAKVESNFNPRAINMNSNGTYDFGLMQINSSWAATIGKERWKQLGDACTNAKTGAWILSMCMNKYGYTWKAIGCYNSQTPDKRDRYSRLVFNQLQHVKPLAQEASYAPLKDSIEELVRQKVDGWVDEAAQGKQQEFTAKARTSIPTAKDVQQETPSLTDSALQTALPGMLSPQTSLSIAPETSETAEEQGQNATPGAGVMP
jgi:hypothetical protein